MTTEINERLSALIDNELSSAETAETLSRMKRSAELRGAWDRYHLIGDSIRGEGVRTARGGIAEAVRERISSEPTVIGKSIPINRVKTGDRFVRPLAGAAIAASVAAVAVFTLPGLKWDAPATTPVQISKSTSPRTYIIPTGTRWKNLSQPKLESKLNRFLENHSEYASAGGMGVVPYSSFVSFDTTRNRP
ncbi:MAG: sigma-E factor negative regulatory protein [Gammaproteobacteria bacterium]|nr:sigma-E factor negative regulatory protein [Gammaproteobacteria bacterium]MCP5418146.1 sigma-E factor negative regulatory protein [Chromatiaceae bacterium]